MKYKIILLILCLLLFVLKRILDSDFLYFPLLIAVALLGCELFWAYFIPHLKAVFPKDLSKKSSVLFLLIIVLTYFILFSFKSTGQFNSFHSRMADLGNMDQAIWNSSKGRLPEATTQSYPFSNKSRLVGHVEPIYLLFAYVYRIKADPRVLLVSQTALVCLAIVAVYLLTQHILGSRIKALAVATIFSLFPSLQFMTLFDFHGDVLAIPFLFFSYHFYITNKKVWYYIFILTALSCKEYVALSLAGYGISLIIMHKDIKNGIATFTLGTGYFLIVLFLIIPFFNQGNSSDLIAWNYSHIGGNEGLAGIAGYAIRNPIQFSKSILIPASMENLFYFMFPLFLIPLRYWGFLPGAIPILLKDLMAGFEIYYHRPALAIPFLFIAFIYSLNEDWHLKFTKRTIQKNYLITLAFISTLIAAYTYGPSPLGHRFWRERNRYFENEHSKTCLSVIKQIPSDAAISVSSHLAPHLTHRRFCYVFPRPSTVCNRSFNAVQFICIDTSDIESLFEGDTSFETQTIPAIYSSGFSLVTKEKSVFLFRKNEDWHSRQAH